MHEPSKEEWLAIGRRPGKSQTICDILEEKVKKMREPSDDEINKTIAEFMGYHLVDDPDWYIDNPSKLPYHAINDEIDYINKYTFSLDALIAPVEKLCIGKDLHFMIENIPATELWIVFEVNGTDERGTYHRYKSPARALSLAVYKVIKECE